MKRGREQMTRGPSTKTLMLNIRSSKREDLPHCLEELHSALETDRFPDLLLSCAVSFPDSMDKYAYMCGLINMEKKVDEVALKKKSVVERIMERLENKLGIAFTFQQISDFDMVRKLIKFLAHLMHAHIISSDDMLAILQKLVVPLSDNENNTSKSYTNFLAYTTVSILPWCAEYILENTSNESILDSIMTPLREYMTLDRQWFNQLSPLCNLNQETEHIKCEDILYTYWNAIESFKTVEDWRLSDAYHSIKPSMFQSIFKDHNNIYKLNLKNIEIPKSCTTVMYKLPVNLTFLHDNVLLSDPSMNKLDICICYDIVCDTIISFQDVKTEGIRTLINLQFNSDYLPSLVEVIFSMLCTLPTPVVNPAYCASLCCDLLKARTSSVPPLFGRIIIAFYKSLDSVDIEVQDRIAELLSLHLSNFSFQWPWKVFVEVLDMPVFSRKRMFVQELIVLCQRLSYYNKMKEILPEELHVFLYVDDVKDDNEDDNENPRLIELFTRKAGFAEVIEILDTMGSLEERVNVFYLCIFRVGSLSFSHFVSYIGRYIDICKGFMQENSSVCMNIILKILSKYYIKSTQYLYILFDKLLNFELLTIQSISTWVFDQNDKFCDCTFWSMFNKIIERRIYQFNQGIAQAKELNMDDKVIKINKQNKEMFEYIFLCFQKQIISQKINNIRVIIEERFCQFMRLFMNDICSQFIELEEQQLSTSINDDTVNISELFKKMHFIMNEAKIYNYKVSLMSDD